MNDIVFIRGDTVELSIELYDDEGNPYEVQQDDVLLWTVKRNTRTKEKILQKQVTDIIRIEHEDTKDLPPTEYVWDLQLTQADGTVTTVIPPSRMRLLDDVTYE